MLSKLAHPFASLQSVVIAWPALHELFAGPSLPPTSLDHLVGADRTIALVRGSLEEVKAVAHNRDAKVNDVLLTVIAGGLRALLCSRREPVEDVVLRIYVPVSLRHGQYAGARGNQIAQMVVPLPIGVSDPVQRLHQIAAVTGTRKARVRPSIGGLPTRGFGGRAVLKLIERQRVNVESADLPGPPIPLYLAGARVLGSSRCCLSSAGSRSASARCPVRGSSTSPPSPTETPTPTSASWPPVFGMTSMRSR